MVSQFNQFFFRQKNKKQLEKRLKFGNAALIEAKHLAVN